MRPRTMLLSAASCLAVIGTLAFASTATTASAGESGGNPKVVGNYHHLVVIYEENHSFDNLYGTWGDVDGDAVEGLSAADPAHTTQVAQDGTPFTCLPQRDVNLTSPPLPTTCTDSAHGVSASHFTNTPFTIDDYIAATDKTCPAPGAPSPNGILKNSPGALAGGCTRDLNHRFYEEKYQIDGGNQDRYVTGSDAIGLTMGVYDTKQLPIYRYLHAPGAPKYVIADHFFQAANGGSFLNHQYLVAARAPIDSSGGTLGARHSVIDSNGMPAAFPQYKPTGPTFNGQLTVACADGSKADFDKACGDFAVNTVQPASPPASNGVKIGLVDDAAYPNIGDRLSDAGVSWNWYAGGWDDAVAGHPGPLFQFHHQPLNYFANYAPGQPGRAHLRDEKEFVTAATQGTLPSVSFVKPYGAENEHPGYASEPDGSDHLVDLLEAIENGPQAGDTLVVVTYDEFGGQWDHVSPPGVGSPTRGVYDAFGPGTRIPALLISRSLPHCAVDHTVYDTTSILATIERGLSLEPLSSRDAQVADLTNGLRAARHDS